MLNTLPPPEEEAEGMLLKVLKQLPFYVFTACSSGPDEVVMQLHITAQPLTFVRWQTTCIGSAIDD
jgi:hypothetical protein